MENKNFTASFVIAEPAYEIFTAITNDVSKWWGGKDFEGNCKKLDDEFVIHHPGAHYSKQKLVEVIPGKRVVWLVKESHLDWLKDPQEWTGTKMIFDIASKGNTTVLHFTHEGLFPEKECYEKCSEGWGMVITDWLFKFIDEGIPHF